MKCLRCLPFTPFLLLLIAAEPCDPESGGIGTISKKDGVTDVYFDLDGDGYGDPATDCGQIDTDAGDTIPEGCVANNGDCDDTNAAIHPGAEEICDGNVDNDCNGLTDANDGAGTQVLEDPDDDGECEVYDEYTCNMFYAPDDCEIPLDIEPPGDPGFTPRF